MSNSEMKFNEIFWKPLNIFCQPANYNHAIVLLNRPINWSTNTILKLWQTAKVKVTVDGGTDVWFEYLNQKTGNTLSNICEAYLPDLVTGDFDSISLITLEKLKLMGLKIIHTPDQNETDYTKALRQVEEYCKIQNIHLHSIYVISETSGRFDHLMANINTLYKCEKLLKDVPVIQVSSDSLTWLLSTGKHKISIPEKLITDQSWCGLIPFGSSSCISTTGLKWNLDKHCLKFGSLVSTSNTYNNAEVTVITDAPVIWTMSIEPLIENEDTISKL